MAEIKVSSDYIRSVLEKYGFENVRRSKNGYTARCKFHNETNPSFSISDTGLWCCFSCGVKGNLTQLHKKLGGNLTWKEELKIVGAQLNIRKFTAREDVQPPALPNDFKPYVCTPLKTRMSIPEYVLNRIKPETVLHFGLGSSNEGRNRGRCIIPITFRGKTVGFHGRGMDETIQPRYYNSPGFDIKEYVFNYDGIVKGKDLIVCEGAFNTMSMWEKGFKNCVATFGIKFTSKQIHKLFTLSPESITVCFDRDSKPSRPGQKAAMQLASMTYQFVPTYIMPLPMDKDPNELPAEVILSCYQKRVLYEKVRK